MKLERDHRKTEQEMNDEIKEGTFIETMEDLEKEKLNLYLRSTLLKYDYTKLKNKQIESGTS